jgi:PilZ domain
MERPEILSAGATGFATRRSYNDSQTVSTRQRDSERMPILGSLQGEVKVYQPISVHQVSLGGMQVETSFPLHLDSLYDFRLTLRDRSIVVKGRVAHSRIIDVDQDIVMYRSGIEFIEPSQPVLETIHGLVEELKSVKR